MEELSDDLYDSIMEDLEKGDDLCEKEHFKTALVHYQKGLDKLPPMCVVFNQRTMQSCPSFATMDCKLSSIDKIL